MNEHHTEIGHFTSRGGRQLRIVLGIVLAVMLAEIIGGIVSHSLALIGDAGHMLVDVLALVLAMLAMAIARRPATPTRTYGYHRMEIMAALANGVILALLAAYIFYEAYQRVKDPPTVDAPIMLVVAAVGLVANMAGILLLRRASQQSLNVKAAFWHVIGDTVSSVGVIIGGVVIAVTGWNIVDPITAIVIGVIILWGAVRIVRESADILLEAVPRDIQTTRVVESIRNVSGVEEVHDVHIWTITSGMHALSAHLLINDQMVSQSAEIVAAVNESLSRDFHIAHTTLQLECEKCESCPSGIICTLGQPEAQVKAPGGNN